MARLPLRPIVMLIAATVSLAVAAKPAVIPPGEPAIVSDEPPVMTAGQRRAGELWSSLSDADKAFVKAFVAEHNLGLLSPDLLLLRAQGKNAEAIKMMSKFYQLDDPARAEIILKFLAYAHDQL